MQTLGIIIIALFLTFCLIIPFVCVFAARKTSGSISDPKPRHLKKARRKLREATVCSSLGPSQDRAKIGDEEAALTISELGECSICIGPLLPEPALLRQTSAKPSLEQVTTSVSSRPPSTKTSSSSSSTSSQETPEEKVSKKEKKSGGKDDDVLTLNTCGHSFHAKCLISWFLIERYDCPICRKVYYKDPKPPESKDANVAMMMFAPA